MECSFAKEDSCCGAIENDSLPLPINACKLDLTTHLLALGISGKRGWRSNSSELSERDLILNRAGFFNLNDEEIASMTICPKHRQELSIQWTGRKRMTCGYPSHKGQRKQMKNPRRVNMKLSQEIFRLCGIVVPVGTGR